MLTFAFYRAPGGLKDRLIRFASGSRHSHVEYVLSHDQHTMLCVSASKRDGNKVRRAVIPIRQNHWDFVTVGGDASAGAFHAIRRIGERYNNIGAVLSVTPIKADLGRGVHCSALMGDICNAAGQPVPTPWRLTPGELYIILQANRS